MIILLASLLFYFFSGGYVGTRTLARKKLSCRACVDEYCGVGPKCQTWHELDAVFVAAVWPAALATMAGVRVAMRTDPTATAEGRRIQEVREMQHKIQMMKLTEIQEQMVRRSLES